MGKRSREKRERRFLEKREEKEYFYQSSLEKICLNIIKAGAYLILFTPLIVSGRFFFPFVGLKSLYFMGLAQIIFFSWLFLIIFNPRYRPRFNLILGSLIFFLIVLIISAALGVDPSYSFWSKPERMTGILMWFHLLAFFLVISSVFQKDDWLKFFSISIFVALILSLITFFSKNPSMRGGATIGNDSFLGTYLLFNLFLALYLIFFTKIELKIYSGICFLIIFLGLFLSGARAAKLSFLGGLILFFFLWLIFCQRGNLRWLGLIFLTLYIISALSFTFFALQPESFVRKEIVKKNVGETFGGRFVVWEGAGKGFLEKPLFGWGPENFEYVFTRYFNPCMFLSECGGEIWYDRAHNIIFDTLVATGIFGMISYLGIFLIVFYLLWQRYFRGEIEFWSAGIFTVLLISYFVQNLTVFDMVSSYLMFFLVLGFVASITIPHPNLTSSDKISSLTSFKPWLTSFLLIVFVFSFFKFIIQPLKTDYYVIVALKAPPVSEERLNYYKKTLQTSPLGKYQIRDFFGQTTLEFAQSEKIREVSAKNFKKEIDFVIEELGKSIKEAPLDFRSHLKLGQLYNAYSILIDQKKISEAEKVLERAIELSPKNQQGYWALAQTRLYQGKPEEALSLAEKAVELEPRLFQSHRIVIEIAKIKGDYQLAKEKMEQAIKINPQWEKDLTQLL